MKRTATIRKLSELKKPDRNVRIHTEKQITEFVRSVDMFGQLRPIIIDEDNVILAGNGLYEAMVALGLTEADCLIAEGLSEAGKKKLMLTDNRIFSLGIDDYNAFDEIIMELDGDFDIPGYDVDLLETLNLDMSGADDMMAGYGTISDEAKEDMKKAAERYDKEESKFVEDAKEYVPVTARDEPSQREDGSARVAPSEQAVQGATREPEQLQRRYLVCPKCGERIWI